MSRSRPLSTSQRLVNEMKAGKKIIYNFPPYEGWEVEYKPRREGDARPWVVNDPTRKPFRAASHACKAVEQPTQAPKE